MISNKKKGDDYEAFVETVYQAILQAEAKDNRIQPIILEKKKTIIGRDESSNEFDIYWEYNIAGVAIQIAIECKSRTSGNVSVKDVRDFAYKLSSCNISKGLVATNTAYQKSCLNVAESEGIDLMILRPLEDKDWDGRIKTIHMNFNFQMPAQTKNITPYIDVDWAMEQGLTENDNINFNTRNDQIIFEDRADGFSCSLFELEDKRFNSNQEGAGQWKRAFKDGWMCLPDVEYKIQGVIIDYVIPDTITQSSVIDFSKLVIAIQEYVNWTIKKPSKFIVLDTGELKPFDPIFDEKAN